MTDISKGEDVAEWDLFLCHTAVDKEWVRELAARLENETSQQRKIRVFFDEWEIQPGTNVVVNLENGVAKAKFVGVVLSPEMLDAEWPTLEWTMAVYEDPSGRRGKVVPILRRDCDIPPSLRIRNILDFRKPEKVERSYAKLLAILSDTPLPRGAGEPSSTSSKPTGMEHVVEPLEFADRVTEQLASNLFPVRAYPSTIWSADTIAQSIGEVYAHLRKFLMSETLPTFCLRENKLHTFWNLNDKACPFRGLLSSEVAISQEESKQWVLDQNKRNWLLELVNRTLWNNCENIGLYRDRKHNRIFFLPQDGHDRVVEWNTGRRKSSRTVVKRYQRGNQGNVFWAHQSAVTRIIDIDDRLFLRIEPGWTFTTNGVEPLPRDKIGSISTRWMFDEYNPSIFYHLRFWIFILSRGKNGITLQAGKSEIEIENTPTTTEMHWGIEGDYLSIDKMYEVAEAETPPVDLLVEPESD
ncbi:MAG TPA: toll/interleukin-1 receptor domain-containing protein [Candidatus Sulfotelmatobacter sp.]|nr:toll/interleukin-1 receptor domain-containing protein [Candidatus Sulfotelmatobacter sp.]